MPEHLIPDKNFVRAVCLLKEQYLSAKQRNPGAFSDCGGVPADILFNPNPYSPCSLDFIHFDDGRLTVAEHYTTHPEEFPVIRAFSSDGCIYFLLERYSRTRSYAPDTRYVPVDCWNTAEEPIISNIGQMIAYSLKKERAAVAV